MMYEGTSRDNGGCRLDGVAAPGPHAVVDIFLVWRRHLEEQLLWWLHGGDWVFSVLGHSDLLSLKFRLLAWGDLYFFSLVQSRWVE